MQLEFKLAYFVTAGQNFSMKTVFERMNVYIQTTCNQNDTNHKVIWIIIWIDIKKVFW